MRVVLCTCADYANSGEGGKLNLMGIFDRIGVREFPAQHGQMVFVVRVLFEYEDSEAAHDIKVELRGPDGGKVLDVGGKVNVGTISAGSFSTNNLIFQLQGVPFERSGTYDFRVLSDGEELATLPLAVIKGAGPRR